MTMSLLTLPTVVNKQGSRGPLATVLIIIAVVIVVGGLLGRFFSRR